MNYDDIFEELKSKLELATPLSKVLYVNNFINKNVQYAEDFYVWGKSDYWATAKETIERGLGDCEDIALAKYETLIKLGIPIHHLLLAYCKLDNIPHLTLIFSDNENNRIILDADVTGNMSKPSLLFNHEKIVLDNHELMVDVRNFIKLNDWKERAFA